jgi:hypothetical protein
MQQQLADQVTAVGIATDNPTAAASAVSSWLVAAGTTKSGCVERTTQVSVDPV